MRTTAEPVGNADEPSAIELFLAQSQATPERAQEVRTSHFVLVDDHGKPLVEKQGLDRVLDRSCHSQLVST